MPTMTVHEEVGRLFEADADLLADPYPTYRRLRDEEPVLQLGRMAVVSRYEDVLHVLKNPETFSSRRNTGTLVAARAEELPPGDVEKLHAIVRLQGMAMTENDDPEHAQKRGMVNHAFTPRRVNAMRADVQRMADHLIAAAGASGHMELVQELAFPLPLQVIVTMFGAPVEDCDDIRRWSEEIAVAFGTEYSNVPDAYRALQEFTEYIIALIARRRSEGPKDDLLSVVLGDDGHDSLSDEEIVGFFVRTLFAGHETTTNLIGNSLVVLLDHPDQRSWLLAQDDARTWRIALDELLRYRTSVHAVHRVATADTEIRGVKIAAGETVRLLLASANHDERVFDRPDELDLKRESPRHLGLGFGIHTCLGAWLQRLEVEIALTTMLRSFPGLRLTGEIRRRPNFLLAGYEQIPLALA